MFCTRSSTPGRARRQLAVDAVGQQLGIAEDRVQRRAQFVAHIGEELRFVLAGLGELLALLGDLAEQARVLDRQDRLRRRASASAAPSLPGIRRERGAAGRSRRRCDRRRPAARSAPSGSRRRRPCRAADCSAARSRSGICSGTRCAVASPNPVTSSRDVELADLRGQRRVPADRLEQTERARCGGCSGRSRRHRRRSARPSGRGSSRAPRRDRGSS